MTCNTNSIITDSESTQDSSNAIHVAEEDDQVTEMTDDAKIYLVAARILKKHKKAFEELAK